MDLTQDSTSSQINSQYKSRIKLLAMQIQNIFNPHVTAFLGSCNSCIILKSKLRMMKTRDLGNREILEMTLTQGV